MEGHSVIHSVEIRIKFTKSIGHVPIAVPQFESLAFGSLKFITTAPFVRVLYLVLLILPADAA